MPRRRTVDPLKPDPQTLLEVVHIIQEGGVVILPTDTAYGLSGNPTDARVVARIMKAKQRTEKLGMPLLAENLGQAQSVGTITGTAAALATQFWPGALTLIVPARKEFPAGIRGPDNSVALRVPDHVVTLAVIHGTGFPIIGTSANKLNEPSPRTADAAETQLGSLVDLILDAGPTRHEADSTIVNCISDPPKIVREGVLTAQILRPWLGFNQKGR